MADTGQRNKDVRLRRNISLQLPLPPTESQETFGATEKQKPRDGCKLEKKKHLTDLELRLNLHNLNYIGFYKLRRKQQKGIYFSKALSKEIFKLIFEGRENPSYALFGNKVTCSH